MYSLLFCLSRGRMRLCVFSNKSLSLLPISSPSIFCYFSLIFPGITLFWWVKFFSWSVVLLTVFFFHFQPIFFHKQHYRIPFQQEQDSNWLSYQIILFNKSTISFWKQLPKKLLAPQWQYSFLSEKWYNGVNIFVDNRKGFCSVFGWNKTWCLSIMSDGNFSLSRLYCSFIKRDSISTFGKYSFESFPLNLFSNQSKIGSLLFLFWHEVINAIAHEAQVVIQSWNVFLICKDIVWAKPLPVFNKLKTLNKDDCIPKFFLALQNTQRLLEDGFAHSHRPNKMTCNLHSLLVALYILLLLLLSSSLSLQ